MTSSADEHCHPVIFTQCRHVVEKLASFLSCLILHTPKAMDFKVSFCITTCDAAGLLVHFLQAQHDWALT